MISSGGHAICPARRHICRAWHVGQRQPHVIFLDAHQIVIAGMQAHHADELVFRLVVAAIDVRVVLAEAAHAHQARQPAGRFVAIILPVFRNAHRQLAIGMPRRADRSGDGAGSSSAADSNSRRRYRAASTCPPCSRAGGASADRAPPSRYAASPRADSRPGALPAARGIRVPGG